MNVHELIKKLESFPPFTDVILDITSPNMTMFMFAELREVSMGSIDEEDEEVLILSTSMDSELSEKPPFENVN